MPLLRGSVDVKIDNPLGDECGKKGNKRCSRVPQFSDIYGATHLNFLFQMIFNKTIVNTKGLQKMFKVHKFSYVW